MKNYVCKVANLKEINKYYNKKIKQNPADASLKVYKKHFIDGVKNGSRIMYFGTVNDEVVCKTCAIIKEEENMQNSQGLIDANRVYLTAFETLEEYRNKGYFKKLYEFMENDLRDKGYKELTLGVEPCEIKNMQIYFHLGFLDYIKFGFETFEPEVKGEEGKRVLVCYYKKNLY